MPVGRCCSHCGNLYSHSYWADAPRRALCAYCFAVGNVSMVDSLYAIWCRNSLVPHARVRPAPVPGGRRMVPLPRPTGVWSYGQIVQRLRERIERKTPPVA